MENYVGKICPFCKTEILEGEAVKVCPECNIPHHESCWEENRGCTTFGCSNQYYEPQGTNPTSVCQNCGAALGDGQAFCPKCGTSKATVNSYVCGKCGEQLAAGQEFCPKCGQKAGLIVDPDVNAAINQFNSGVKPKKKSIAKVIVPIVIAVVALMLVFAIVGGIVLFFVIKNKRAEQAREDYISNAETFAEEIIDAGTNLEDIADTVQEYWYENIWYDLHGSDIDDAIYYAMMAKSSEIDVAESDKTSIDSLFAELKYVPDEVSDEDERKLQEICDAVNDLYDVYCDYYTLATDPSGSYNTYSASNEELTAEFIDCYEALYEILY